MRPRLHYVVWRDGQVIAITHGAEAAERLSVSYRSFKTRREAEEYATWWTYEREKDEPIRRALFREKMKAKGFPEYTYR